MNHPYQVLGPSVPKMLGRRRLLEQLERHLLKPSPDHVQVVGPTLYGKSVVLSHLARMHSGGSAHYLGAAYVDLRHAPPGTDDDFRRRFAELVREALATAKSPVVDYLDFKDAGLHDLMVLVFDELDRAKQRLLLVLDGFDHVLAGTGLTRNLWDQLRSLAQKGSLRLITGSRRPLRELCKTEESRTSDLWEIFYDTPVSIGAFNEPDWDDLLAPLVTGGLAVDSSGQKEILNWSGGIPVLAIALLQKVADGATPGSTCTKADVDAAAGAMLDERRELLAVIWEDCDGELRSDLASLASREAEGILITDLSDGRRRALEQRGLGTSSSNRMRTSCRLMAKFALQQAPAVADLKRLFATREGFEANVRGLLEHRLAQVLDAKIDSELRALLNSAVRDLEPNPELSLKWVRSIAERALALIWQAELGLGQKLPNPWLTEWKLAGERLHWLGADQSLPRKKGAQCGVLRLATGADNIRPMAKFATKPTALLVDSLHSIGDFALHRDDFPESSVSKSFAAAVVMSAIELVESLTRDLART